MSIPPPQTDLPRRRPSRHPSWRSLVISTLVTVFWLGMMFTLLKDRILPQRREAALAAQAVAPSTLVDNWRDSEEFMLVKLGQKEVGGATSSVRRILDGQVPGYTADFRFAVLLNLLGVTRQAVIRARGELDSKFDLSSFAIDADLSSYKIEIAGAMVGDELLVEVRRDGQPTRARYRLNRQISLLDAVRPIATRNFEIRPGNTLALPVVDPIWSMNQGTLELRVKNPEEILLHGEKVTAWPVEMRLNDFVSTSWVDQDGNTLRRQLAAGLILERATPGRVKSTSPELMTPIEVRPIRVEDFAGIPATPLSKFKEEGKTPLETLGSLMP